MDTQSLAKAIADSGFASRHEASQMIVQGRVLVNGKQANQSTKYKDGDEVAVDFEVIKIPRRDELEILAFHKPVGFNTANNADDKLSIMHHIKHNKKVMPTYSLEKDISGLVLLASNGNLAQKCGKMGLGIHKEYWVRTVKPITPEGMRILSNGMRLDGLWYKPVKVKLLARKKVSITLDRECTRLLNKLIYITDNKLESAMCVKFMNVFLGDLAPGKFRKLSHAEKIKMLQLLDDAAQQQRQAKLDAKENRAATKVKTKKPGAQPTSNSKIASVKSANKKGTIKKFDTTATKKNATSSKKTSYKQFKSAGKSKGKK